MIDSNNMLSLFAVLLLILTFSGICEMSEIVEDMGEDKS